MKEEKLMLYLLLGQKMVYRLKEKVELDRLFQYDRILDSFL